MSGLYREVKILETIGTRIPTRRSFNPLPVAITPVVLRLSGGGGEVHKYDLFLLPGLKNNLWQISNLRAATANIEYQDINNKQIKNESSIYKHHEDSLVTMWFIFVHRNVCEKGFTQRGSKFEIS
jgi:hypothetical protein